MKYDDASWHSGGDFPAELEASAGATHIAMFVAWAAFRGLVGELHTNDDSSNIEQLLSRTVIPAQWFMVNCDGKLTNEDLNEQGNLFAQTYYEVEKPPRINYIADYSDVFSDVDPLYAVPDNWETFDKIAPIIDRQFARWHMRNDRTSSLLDRLGLSWLNRKH